VGLPFEEPRAKSRECAGCAIQGDFLDGILFYILRNIDFLSVGVVFFSRIIT